MNCVEITTEFIILGQFLKYIGLISNGSEAKNFIINNKIFVNNVLEMQRGKKLYPGFFIKIGKNEFIIVQKNDWRTKNKKF